MDNFSDLLKYIVPLAIFILSAVFGGKNDKKKSTGHAHKLQKNYGIDWVVDDLLGQPKEQMRPAAAQAKVEPKPKPKQKPAKKSATVNLPKEGESAIFNEHQQKAAMYADLFGDAETQSENDEPQHETFDFDPRKAVIYSTILERKY